MNLHELGKMRKHYKELELNGAPHPSLPKESPKAQHAKAWASVCAGIEEQIATVAAERGWGVEYNGLMPTFIVKGRDRALDRTKMLTR